MRISLCIASALLLQVLLCAQTRNSEFPKHLFTPPENLRDFGAYKSLVEFADGTPVETKEDWAAKRKQLQEFWTKHLGPWPELIQNPKIEYLARTNREAFTQHTVEVEIAPAQKAQGYLLVPNSKGPHPAVLVPFYEPETSIGAGKNESRDFALQLARRGFVTLAIGSPGGDARKPEIGEAICQPLSFLAYVAANCANALASLSEVDPGRIGVVGHSYGGKWAMFAAALSEKFACAAFSDPGIVFDESRSNVNYWEPWYLGLEANRPRKPGVPSATNPRTGPYKHLFEAGHDLHELLALIAPRPFLVSGGSEDPPERWRALNRVNQVYELLGARNRVAMSNRPMHSPTEESNEQIYRFFERFLKKDRDWPVYGGDFEGTKYSPLKQIDRRNVRQLQPAWIYRCDDMRTRPATTIQCNPLVIGGRMFLTTPGLKLVCLDAASGKEIWRYDPWNGTGGRGVNRGMTYWTNGDEERLFLPAGSFIHAIDAQSGNLIDDFGENGKMDLREGLDRDVYFLSVNATSPGIVYKDLLIIGSSVGEGPNPAAPGHIRAFDVRTGKRRWIFHTIPHPGEVGYETWPPDAWKTIGGANSWGGLTLDPARGMVFAGTGSPSYDHYGGNRAGQNLFANCVLALNADTGERIWHYQVVHHDLWDYDIPCPPNLVTVRHQGRMIDAVAQSTKMGYLFLFDRESGNPLFEVTERPVPASTIPGEKSWPTQPLPTRPAPFAHGPFTENDVTDLSPESRDFVLKKIRTMDFGDVYTPPGTNASVVMPQFNGGGEWGGAAFDPESRLLYVNASNEAEWISMVASKPRDEMALSDLGAMLYGTICSSCHGFEQANNPEAPSFPTLKRIKERLTKAQVHEIVEKGRNQMPSFATLSEVERKAIVTFLFGEKSNEKVATRDLELSWANEIPYVATGHHDFRDQDGYPINKRPWGTLNAIDLDKGEIRWQVPLGTYPKLEAKGLPPTGTFNIGGPLVTAGGLVFIGAAMDERFHAFDKETGELIWEFQMEAGGYATPATYSVNGKQFVVIAAGGGGKPGTKPGNAYYCFALPD